MLPEIYAKKSALFMCVSHKKLFRSTKRRRVLAFLCSRNVDVLVENIDPRYSVRRSVGANVWYLASPRCGLGRLQS